jgi:hypothetical protein
LASLHSSKEDKITDGILNNISLQGQGLLEDMHLSSSFNKTYETLKALISSGSPILEVRLQVLREGWPILDQWILGRRASLGGHDIYKLLSEHRLPGGKQLVRSLCEFLGLLVVRSWPEANTYPHMARYMVPQDLVMRLLNGDADGKKPFDFESFLDDFLFALNFTPKAGLTRSKSFQDDTRLRQMTDLVTPILEGLGCGSSDSLLSFGSLMKSALNTKQCCAPLQGTVIYDRFISQEPYGLIPWMETALAAGFRNITARLATSVPIMIPALSFLPLSHTQSAETLLVVRSVIRSEVEKQLIQGT